MTAYLDHNATTPLRPEVLPALEACYGAVGNASSVHVHGRQAKERLEHARAQVAGLINAKASEVVFTSGGAEANNLALGGGLGSGVDHLIVSAIEHDSVLNCVQHLSGDSSICAVGSNGVIDLDRLSGLLDESSTADHRVLISIMMANNETGVVQPISAVVSLARDHGALVHCDAVQGLGKLPIDFAALDVDFLSLSAHKIGGPQGVGALIVKSGRGLEPLIRGGGQESNRRAGTENLPGIVGFGVAAELVLRDGLLDTSDLRDELEQRIAAIAPESMIFGQSESRICNTTCFAVEGLRAETQVMAMDLAGVSISAGSACSSGKVTSSHVLTAMGAEESIASSAVRVSLGWNSTQEDVEQFVQAWASHYEVITKRQMKAAS